MSNNRINISDLKPKDNVESTYMVKYLAVMEARDGKKYLNIVLSDSTGDIEGRSWNDAEKIESEVAKGDFLQVSGKINSYQGKKQFILSSYKKVDKGEVNTDDFIAKSKLNPDEMFSSLLQIINSLSDVYIRELLLEITQDSEIQRRLKTWQAGKSIHHAYQSGLLEHVLSCSKLAVMLSDIYGCNKNYVVAGAILHDLCKIYELSDGVNVEYTEEGKLVGHLVKSLEVIDRFSYRIKGFPYNLKLHLKHIMLSHHGEYAYGSPKIPQTKEAMLVHLIDLMDSKMHSFETVIKNDSQLGHWSNYVKHLDRIIYKDELPYYPEKVVDTKAPKKPKAGSAEIKNSMSDLLKDFQVKK